MATQRFTCYWLGYMQGNTFSLEQIPEYVEYVNLFLINIDETNYVNYNYITSQGFTWQDITTGVQALQARGQKVIASLMSTPQFNFNQISDPTTFAQGVVDVVINQWGLDGINIDPEIGQGTAPNQSFIDFVSELRTAMGSSQLLTYVSYEFDLDQTMLQSNMTNLDWVSLMGYFWDTGSYQSQWTTYSAVVPPAQLLIGIKPGMTTMSTTTDLATWQLAQGGGGMMEFQINSDPSLSYAAAINGIIA